jgi:hypothetical protein
VEGVARGNLRENLNVNREENLNVSRENLNQKEDKYKLNININSFL